MILLNTEIVQYTLRVIRAVMGQKAIPPIPENVNLEELYRFAKLHNVEAMVYHGLSQLEMDEQNPVWQNWENRAAMLMAQSIVQMADRDALFTALTAAEIPVLPIKGCWMKECYPNMEYRQMADLDMLIPKDRDQQARKLLLSMGYQTEAYENTPYHAGFLKPPYTQVELHIGLLPEDGGYYDNVWQRVQKVEGYPCLYRFRPEDEYIYYLLHMNKHLEDAGIGIRSVLDHVVFEDAFPDMNWDYVNKELEKLNLAGLGKSIMILAERWFRSGNSIPVELEAMANSILTAGSYGTMENRSRHRLEQLDQKYRNPVIKGIVYWVIQICRPREELSNSFPVLDKLPVLLPFFWVYRAVMKFANNPKKIMRHIKLVFGREKENG